MDQCETRTRVAFLNRRTQKIAKLRQFKYDTNKFLPASEAQRNRIHAFMHTFAQQQDSPAFYKVVDIARRVAGTGSLGLERYAILVEGKGAPDKCYLLDLKQAQSSSIAKHLPVTQPRWISEAERIVTIQQRMQAVSMAFLHAVSIEKQTYILHGLQPSEDRVPIPLYHNDINSLTGLIHNMAQCLAWAHLRSSGRQTSAIADDLIDFAQRNKWRNKLSDLAQEMAIQTQLDWRTYCQGYDDNLFQLD